MAAGLLSCLGFGLGRVPSPLISMYVGAPAGRRLDWGPARAARWLRAVRVNRVTDAHTRTL